MPPFVMDISKTIISGSVLAIAGFALISWQRAERLKAALHLTVSFFDSLLAAGKIADANESVKRIEQLFQLVIIEIERTDNAIIVLNVQLRLELEQIGNDVSRYAKELEAEKGRDVLIKLVAGGALERDRADFNAFVQRIKTLEAKLGILSFIQFRL